jgi:hypothetical protein
LARQIRDRGAPGINVVEKHSFVHQSVIFPDQEPIGFARSAAHYEDKGVLVGRDLKHAFSPCVNDTSNSERI